MVWYSVNDGYTVEDMMHFGFGHVEAARALFEDDIAFLDSAGYLAHLGTEVVLKAMHLHWFGKFCDTHKLVELYNMLKEKNALINVGTETEAFLADLDTFYLLRYPRREKGPVEIGTDQLKKFDAFLDAIWLSFPKELVDIYEKLDPTRKGGRVLMRKKIKK